MALGARGTRFVGSRRAGRVCALAPRDRDDRAGEVRTIASGLNTPNGVAFRDGSLYVAELNRVVRYDGVLDAVKAASPGQSLRLKPTALYDNFPSDPLHG